ncbi:hypothetical protein AAFN85_09405 [Mucilaginibacter sp. CAU 1740]|uniref:hypothetical protein n=1 Tax=Mucilaginibacter sp. CAU 1740 TaxID=3140365 RepID=UPI00325B3CFA
MVIAIIIMLLIGLVLSRRPFVVGKQVRFFMINILIMIFYNLIIWGCISLFWNAGGADIVPILCGALLNVLHIVFLLIVIIKNAVKEQSQ